ncbi:hypothetical protein GH733_012993, partial [Mirounga leonina]
MPNGQFKDIRLSDYKGKYILFFFYPLEFTFVCPGRLLLSVTGEKNLRNSPSDWCFCGFSFLSPGMDQHTQETRRTGTHEHSLGIRPQDYGLLKADEGISFRGLFI